MWLHREEGPGNCSISVASQFPGVYLEVLEHMMKDLFLPVVTVFHVVIRYFCEGFFWSSFCNFYLAFAGRL